LIIDVTKDEGYIPKSGRD